MIFLAPPRGGPKKSQQVIKILMNELSQVNQKKMKLYMAKKPI